MRSRSPLTQALGPSHPVQAAKNLSVGVEKKGLTNEELIARLQSSLLKVKEESHEVPRRPRASVHLTRARRAERQAPLCALL